MLLFVLNYLVAQIAPVVVISIFIIAILLTGVRPLIVIA